MGRNLVSVAGCWRASLESEIDESMSGEMTIVRTADEREMKRLVKKGAVVMAEYDFRNGAVESLRARGRWWILQVPAASSEQAA